MGVLTQGGTGASPTSQEQLGGSLESPQRGCGTVCIPIISLLAIQVHLSECHRAPVRASSRRGGESPSVCRRGDVSPSFVWSGSRAPVPLTPFPRLPSWDVTPLTARQASAAETRAPPQLFSLTINTGANLTPFPCLAFVNHHPFFY